MDTGPNDCVHLTIAQVLEIHSAVLGEFGGLAGIADQGLLEAAVAAPQATVFGQSPYADLIEVAAAYLFFLCRNHPFRDGNKRAAMTAAIVFLRLNGVELKPDGPAWESLVLDVAASRLDRDQTTRRLRKLAPRARD
jgi:death-on-curing protein